MLTEILLRAALIGAEWVLWLLVVLSVLSVLAMIDRGVFFARRQLDIQAVRQQLEELLTGKKFEEAAKYLESLGDAMQARVVLFGLRDWKSGAAAVEDRMSGALATERYRYDKHLSFLGTLGNNAPFIGLFGTVLGIIGAFDNLSSGSQEAAQAVMAAIAEALVATGVGLLVAIPAVVAFNTFKTATRKSVAQTDLLGRTLLAYLRPPGVEDAADGTSGGEPVSDGRAE